MKIVTAPSIYIEKADDVTCFLAGGITNCPDWQHEVIRELKMFDVKFPRQLQNLVVFNPRRDNFPIDNPDAAQEQIEWEFKWLQRMDLFSMYFTAGESDQPICMYELGRNLLKMMMRFPDDYAERILISCDPLYKRAQDVKIQTRLAFSDNMNSWEPDIIDKADPRIHASHIIHMYKVVNAVNEDRKLKRQTQD